MVGIRFGGGQVTDYANDFWLVSGPEGGEPEGYVTSPWYSPELETNIGLAYVPFDLRAVGTRLTVHLPVEYAQKLAGPISERITLTEDSIEGPKAFSEKRRPQWKMR